MKSLIIFIFLLTGFVYGQKPNGEYHRPNKGGGFTVILNENGTYKQTMYDCTWGWETKGTWAINNDTVLLRANKMRYRHGKKEMSPDTISTGFDSYNSWKKFVFKYDTLFRVRHNQLTVPLTKRALK